MLIPPPGETISSRVLRALSVTGGMVLGSAALVVLRRYGSEQCSRSTGLASPCIGEVHR
jgi:hypothetical protein